MHHHRGRSTAPLLLISLAALLWVNCIGDTPPGDDPLGDAFFGDGPHEPTPQPRLQAHFTQPAPGQPDNTLGDLIIDLLAQTPDDATVRGAFFTFSRQPIAEAFADARARGVDVEIVLGNTNRAPGGGDWSAVTLLRDALGDALTICRDGQSTGGCLGENIHHNKFLTFSHLQDGSRHVVLQSSGNLTNFQRTQYDNMVTIFDDPTLYGAFNDYWHDLRAGQLDPNYNQQARGDSPTTVYFSPFTDYDPVYDDISQIDCAQGGQVYLAMAFFTDYRAPIALRLNQMDQEGCQIHVLLRHSDINSPGPQIMGVLRQGQIDMGYFPEEDEIQLHSKYLVYRGVHDGEEQRRSVVWTGSHNYTRAALYHNDEVLMRIEDDQLFEDFVQDWQFMRHRAETRHP